MFCPNKKRAKNPYFTPKQTLQAKLLPNPSHSTTYKLHSTTTLPITHLEKQLKTKQHKTQFITSHKPSQASKSKQNQQKKNRQKESIH